MSSNKESLFLDFRKNAIEGKMMHDKKCFLAQAFNWVAFGGAIATLVLSLFILLSTSITMLIVNTTDLGKIQSAWNFMTQQFNITKVLFIVLISIIGAFIIASSVFYFLFLKGCPSTKLIRDAAIIWGFGLIIIIVGLLVLNLGYSKLNSSYYRYENTIEKIIVCIGCLLGVFGSQMILVPNIMLLTGHKKFDANSSVCGAYRKVNIVGTVFASLEIGLAGFVFFNMLIFGTNKGAYSTVLQYMWVTSYFVEFIVLLSIISLLLIKAAFVKKTSLIVRMSITNVLMCCGFILSFYFICSQYYANTQAENTFNLLGIFKIAIPSIFFLIDKGTGYRRFIKSIK